jgi:hypothetical protein
MLSLCLLWKWRRRRCFTANNPAKESKTYGTHDGGLPVELKAKIVRESSVSEDSSGHEAGAPRF